MGNERPVRVTSEGILDGGRCSDPFQGGAGVQSVGGGVVSLQLNVLGAL